MPDMPRSTRALLDLLPQFPAGRVLDIGSAGAAVAAATGGTYLHVELPACEAAANTTGVQAVVHADTLPVGPFDLIAFDAREWDPGLAAEFVARVAGALGPSGVLLTSARPEVAAPHFSHVDLRGDVTVAAGPTPNPVEVPWSSYSFTFGDRSFTVQSAPGIFSPRGLDEGTRAMLEVMAASLPPTPARFLDLGCGAGVVSLVATELWGFDVTAVDTNARAVRISTQNAPGAKVVASDGFRQLDRSTTFDIIASNPPYHTDFAVARQFIEGAYRRLALGGTLYLVVKRADWYVQKVRATFGGAGVTEQYGYTVIAAQKRPPREQPAQPAAQPTTKKHARRMAASAGKKHR